MIDEKLADKIGVSPQEQTLAVLKQIEKHLKALVFYTTPEKAFLPTAGTVSAPPVPKGSDDDDDLNEVIKKEIEKYLKENE
jgi:hypothetical protein